VFKDKILVGTEKIIFIFPIPTLHFVIHWFFPHFWLLFLIYIKFSDHSTGFFEFFFVCIFLFHIDYCIFLIDTFSSYP